MGARIRRFTNRDLRDDRDQMEFESLLDEPWQEAADEARGWCLVVEAP